MEPPRFELPRMDPPRLEQPRMELSRIKQPWFEQPRMEPPRFEQLRMEPPCFEHQGWNHLDSSQEWSHRGWDHLNSGFIGRKHFKANQKGLGLNHPKGLSRIGSRLDLSSPISLETNLMCPHETNLMCPHKIGEIGQEMIIMVETFLRRVYLTEG